MINLVSKCLRDFFYVNEETVCYNSKCFFEENNRDWKLWRIKLDRAVRTSAKALVIKDKLNA